MGQKPVQTNSRSDRNTAHEESCSKSELEHLQTERPQLLLFQSHSEIASHQVVERCGPCDVQEQETEHWHQEGEEQNGSVHYEGILLTDNTRLKAMFCI